jgi:putative hydrolase of the HAD superfamily
VKKSTRIAAVTFDVGGTLIEPWPSVGHVYAEAAARHGLVDISPEVLNARFKDAWRAATNFDYTKGSWENLVNETFQGLAPLDAQRAFFPELYEQFAQEKVWRIFDDVRPTLERLAASGVRLAVISNWDERLRGLLRRLNLNLFETLAISCEVGFPKPSPAIFNHAARELDLWPGAILHVGDSLELDVAGARGAGFRALHLQRGNGALAGDSAIRSLVELPERLAAD